ncbi:MAG: hypothetical protein R3F02_11035 [Thiolinea sp.]
MNINVPSVKEYYSFSLKDVVDRWFLFHQDKLPIYVRTNKESIQWFVVDSLKQQGLGFSQVDLDLLKKGLDFTKPDCISGRQLIDLEKKVLGYEWRWVDNLRPAWGYWLEVGRISIIGAACLSNDIDPDVVLTPEQQGDVARSISTSQYLWELDEVRGIPEKDRERKYSYSWSPRGRDYEFMDVYDRQKFHRWALKCCKVRTEILISNRHLMRVLTEVEGGEAQHSVLDMDSFLRFAHSRGWEPDHIADINKKVRPVHFELAFSLSANSIHLSTERLMILLMIG